MTEKNSEDIIHRKLNGKPLRVGLVTFAGLLIGVSIFTSGWLFGSGRLSFRSGTLVPSIERNASIPTDGIDELYTKIQENFDGEVDSAGLLDGMKRGMTSALGDPYSEFLNAEDAQAFDESLNGTFEGIGAELGREGDFVVIVSPIRGMPAEKAGLRAGDIIVEIDGESSTGITVSEAVKRIRGPKGETVVLTIVRDGEQSEISIVRDTIDIPSVESEIRGDIGIITISRFGDDTARLARASAAKLAEQNVGGVVLDLRSNPGGLLDAAVEVSAIWLDRNSIVLEEKRGDKVVQTLKTKNGPVLPGIDTIVLINEGSASASEIVAGALKDHGKAKLFGVTTYGKGSVQRLIPLSGGGSLKITIARWFTPAGKNIDKEGIKPDKEIERTSADVEADYDPQLDEALSELRR